MTAQLKTLSVQARVFDDGMLGVKIKTELMPGTYQAVLVLAGRLPEPEHQPQVPPAALLPLNEHLERSRREHIRRALAVAGGNRTQAARLLGVDTRTVFRFIEKHGPAED